MQFSWHLFGNDGTGYRTLRHSKDLDSQTCERLERFTWGQSNDGAYLASLDASPAIWVEPVKGRQDLFALTRILRGHQDADGRPSLRFATLLVPPEVWANEVAPALFEVACNDTLWDFDCGTEKVSVALCPEAHAPGQSQMQVVERVLRSVREAAVGRSTVVVPVTMLDLVDLCWIVQQLRPDERQSMSLAYGALTDGVNVRLLCLAAGHVATHCTHSRLFLKPDGSAPREVRAQTSSRVISRPGPVVPSARRGVGSEPLLEDSRTPRLELQEKKPMNLPSTIMMVLILALVCVFGVINSVALGSRTEALKSDTGGQLKAIADRLDEMKAQNVEILTLLSDLQRGVAATHSDTSNLREALAGMKVEEAKKVESEAAETRAELAKAMAETKTSLASQIDTLRTNLEKTIADESKKTESSVKQECAKLRQAAEQDRSQAQSNEATIRAALNIAKDRINDLRKLNKKETKDEQTTNDTAIEKIKDAIKCLPLTSDPK